MRRDIAIVFQDPYAALDPRMMVGDIVTEPLQAFGITSSRTERMETARTLLSRVGLRPEFVSRFPHEFSGGQRQRIGIARAIATSPKLIVLDEPISALDISIRAQILNLLADLQTELGLSYLFIAHDLSVVRHICDRSAVMYMGIIVEEGPSDRVFSFAKHPYTQALLASVPVTDPSQRRRREPLEGDVPSPVHIPSGCRFRTRCPLAADICTREVPLLRDLGNGHSAACHFATADV
jgi:oligopeptide transport system ATP-binding protein